MAEKTQIPWPIEEPGNAAAPPGEEQESILFEAMSVYGLETRHVLGWRADAAGQNVTLVTCGGRKVRHAWGEPAQFELSEVDKTGIAPEPDFVWCDRLNQKVDRNRANPKCNAGTTCDRCDSMRDRR